MSQRKLSILFAATAAVMFAGAASANDLTIWTDASPGKCDSDLRAKVVSVKAKKSDVLVRVKLDKSGKMHTATVGGAKPQDFKIGSPFCAQDYVSD